MNDSVFILRKEEPRTHKSANPIPSAFFCIRSHWIGWTHDIYKAVRFADEASARDVIAQLGTSFGETYDVDEYEWPWE